MEDFLEMIRFTCNIALGYIVYYAAHSGHWDIAAGICAFLALEAVYELRSKLFEIYLRLGR